MFENLNNAKVVGTLKAIDKVKYPNSKSDYFFDGTIEGVSVELSASAKLSNHPEYGESIAIYIKPQKKKEEKHDPMDRGSVNKMVAEAEAEAPNPDDIPF